MMTQFDPLDRSDRYNFEVSKIEVWARFLVLIVVVFVVFGMTSNALHKMRATATNGVACPVCLSACLSVGHVCEPAKTAEPIEMSFGG